MVQEGAGEAGCRDGEAVGVRAEIGGVEVHAVEPDLGLLHQFVEGEVVVVTDGFADGAQLDQFADETVGVGVASGSGPSNQLISLSWQ